MLVQSVNDGVWTFVGGLERGSSCICSDENELCLVQAIRDVDLDCTVGASGDRLEVTDLLTEVPEVILDRCLSTIRDEITRDCECRTINHVGWRGIEVFLRSGPKAKEDPGEFVDPVRTS